MKYKKWIDNNCQSLENKTVVITGATGGIGEELVKCCLYLKANVIMAVRNIEKANLFIKQLEEDGFNDPLVYKLDLSSFQSIQNFIDKLKEDNIKVDYFIHNAGVYHLKNRTTEDNHDIHYQTNYLAPYYITKHLDGILTGEGKIVYVNSISYLFAKLKYDDIECINFKNKTTQYATTKLEGILSCISLYDNYNIVLTHPGVSATAMISSKAGGFGKMFDIFITPLCKLVFMKPDKACLSVMYGLNHSIPKGYISGPRGFLSFWGYPKVQKLNKKIYKNDIELLMKKTQETL